MKLTYTNVNGYLIPNFTYKSGEQMEQLVRILAIIAVLLIVVIVMAIIMEIIKQYKRMWDKISQMFLFGSFLDLTVLGDTISEYLSVNLLMIFLIINAGVVLLRISIRENEYI